MMDLQDIRDYLFCSLWFYLKRFAPRLLTPDGEAGIHPYTTLELPGLAFAQALALHATGRHPHPFPVLADLVWQTWMVQKGMGDDLLQAARGYARLRNEILGQFTSGRIRKAGGQAYIEPRMTTRYANMLENAGLTKIASRIEETGREKLGAGPAELPGVGPYFLADAYADTVWMAERYTPPLPEAVHGLSLPVQVKMDNGGTISARADLVIAGVEESTVEVHDAHPAFALQRSWANRRLDVLAALQMIPAGPHKPFPPVGKVIYRHLMSGKTIERRRVRAARLSFAFEAARRGVQAGVFIPQYLSGDLSRCRGCRAQEVCITPQGDISEWFQPGSAALAGQVRDALRQIGPVDAVTVRKILAALEVSLLPVDLLTTLDTNERTSENDR
jgi:hypothetical protein